MPKENRIDFKHEYKTKELNMYLLFDVYENDNHMHEKKVSVGCYEGVEAMFKYYFAKDWKELFYGDHFLSDYIDHVEFKGIYMWGQKDDDKVQVLLENNLTSYISFDSTKHDAKNAETIVAIRNIIGQ